MGPISNSKNTIIEGMQAPPSWVESFATFDSGPYITKPTAPVRMIPINSIGPIPKTQIQTPPHSPQSSSELSELHQWRPRSATIPSPSPPKIWLASEMMKRSLRIPFSLLLLSAAFTFLLFRSALQRSFGFGSHPFPQPANPNLNSSLLSLASADPVDSAIRREVEDLIEGNLPLSIRGDAAAARHRSISTWRRDNHDTGGLVTRIRPSNRFQIRLRSPKDYRIFPEFRRSLRDWIRLRRLHPQIISLLPSLIKRPLDLHFRKPGSEPVTGPPQLYNSCAVVGNSGILLKSAHGDLIDSHDAVIRLNNARTQGYGRHVGSKTTISFVNSNILHLCARRESCFCHPYGENVPIVMYICQPIHFLDYAACNSSHKAPLLVTDPRFDLLCASIVKYYSLKRFVEETGKVAEEWSKVHDEKMFHYSSGMQAVMLAAGICERVSVFGFGKSEEAKHHYHTNQKAELDLHDYEAEYAFYKDLAERPQVNTYYKKQ